MPEEFDKDGHIQLDQRGAVEVNEFLQSTTNPRVYAAGDVVLPAGSIPQRQDSRRAFAGSACRRSDQPFRACRAFRNNGEGSPPDDLRLSDERLGSPVHVMTRD